MSSSSIQSIILILPLILVFYFLIIRPQRKQKNAKILLLKNLKKGDSVITYSGIHGTIAKINDLSRTILIEISKNTEVVIEKEAIFKNLTKEDIESKENLSLKKNKEDKKKNLKK